MITSSSRLGERPYAAFALPRAYAIASRRPAMHKHGELSRRKVHQVSGRYLPEASTLNLHTGQIWL